VRIAPACGYDVGKISTGCLVSISILACFYVNGRRCRTQLHVHMNVLCFSSIPVTCTAHRYHHGYLPRCFSSSVCTVRIVNPRVWFSLVPVAVQNDDGASCRLHVDVSHASHRRTDGRTAAWLAVQR